jgi:spermidine synthase
LSAPLAARGEAGAGEAGAGEPPAGDADPLALGRRDLVARFRFYWVVAVCGAVIMALEILASRVLAPAFGNSVYVWGSIISVFLAALAVGYRLGGRLADRAPSLAALGRLILFAALAQAVLLLAGRQLVAWLGELTAGSAGGTLLASAILFGPASVLLATVSPYAVRLAARDLLQLGDTAGRLFALSTAGSLVGTLGCTFVLIPFLELQPLLAMLLGLTTLTGMVALGAPSRRQVESYALAVALVGLSVVKGVGREELPPLLLYSGVTPYQTLAVGDLDDRRYLTSNGMLHSAVVRATGEPGVGYIRYVALGALFQPEMKRALMIGMGSGSAGVYLQRRMPGLVVDYVDVDPQVPRLARRFFDFQDGPASRVHVDDGRRFLANSAQRWDFIFSDTYIGFSVPFHLATREFMAEVKAHLQPDGVFAMNLAAGVEDPFSRAIYATVRTAFPATRVFATRGSGGVVLVAGGGVETYLPDLRARARLLDERFAFSPALVTMLPLELAVEPRPNELVLSDEFAPVEHLVPIGRMKILEERRWQELHRRLDLSGDGAAAGSSR